MARAGCRNSSSRGLASVSVNSSGGTVGLCSDGPQAGRGTTGSGGGAGKGSGQPRVSPGQARETRVPPHCGVGLHGDLTTARSACPSPSGHQPDGLTIGAKPKALGWGWSRWAGEISQDSLLKDGLRAAPRQEGPRGVGWELAPGLEGSRLLHVESWCWQGPAICGARRARECKVHRSQTRAAPSGPCEGLVAAGRGG